MEQRYSFLILLLFTFNLIISAQLSEFGINEKSYYSKVLRLGSAYTGYAKGIESINTNSAGLASTEMVSILYSDAYAGPLLINKAPSYSISLAIPGVWNRIVFGASYNRLSMDLGKENEWVNSKFALHIARKFSSSFSMGLSLNYFRIDSRTVSAGTVENPESSESYSVKVDAYDISLGLLYKIEDPFYINVPNRFGLGMYIENLLATKASYSSSNISEFQLKDQHKYQQIRLGTSYEITSSKMKFNDLDFIKMLFVFDAIFNTRNYDFLTWQPNYGIEFTLLDVLSLSYGRENEIKIDNDVYGSTSAYPVSRYGIGINLPLQKMFGLPRTVNIEINYSYSDWQKFETNFLTSSKIDKRGLSFGLSWQI